jgi:hypothetical protein
LKAAIELLLLMMLEEAGVDVECLPSRSRIAAHAREPGIGGGIELPTVARQASSAAAGCRAPVSKEMTIPATATLRRFPSPVIGVSLRIRCNRSFLPGKNPIGQRGDQYDQTGHN